MNADLYGVGVVYCTADMGSDLFLIALVQQYWGISPAEPIWDLDNGPIG